MVTNEDYTLLMLCTNDNNTDILKDLIIDAN